jgi:hypothetical protein
MRFIATLTSLVVLACSHFSSAQEAFPLKGVRSVVVLIGSDNDERLPVMFVNKALFETLQRRLADENIQATMFAPGRDLSESLKMGFADLTADARITIRCTSQDVSELTVPGMTAALMELSVSQSAVLINGTRCFADTFHASRTVLAPDAETLVKRVPAYYDGIVNEFVDKWKKQNAPAAAPKSDSAH